MSTPPWGSCESRDGVRTSSGCGFLSCALPASRFPCGTRSFDLVISEYGAAIWADPYRWIPEAARLLHPGGELVFLGNSTLLMLCTPDEDGVAATDRLVRPQYGMQRFEWPDDPTVEFHLGHGDWIRLLRANLFEVEDLIELWPPAGASSDWPLVGSEWASRWPCAGGLARPTQVRLGSPSP